MSEELKVIYLQPKCCVDPEFGRVWCEHDSPEPCPDGKNWTKYAIIPEGFALVPIDKLKVLNQYTTEKVNKLKADAVREAADKLTNVRFGLNAGPGMPIAWLWKYANKLEAGE